MRRTYFHIALLLLLMPSAVSAQAFSADAWLEDFAQLKRELAGHYANLEWAIEARGLNLPRLSAETEARLRQARSDAEAQQAFQTFLRAFGDGHVGVRWPAATASTPTPAATPATLCERLGYRTMDVRAGVDFAGLPGFEPLETPDSARFPSGILSLPDGRRVGVLRIALFVDTRFPDLCTEAVASLGLAPDAPSEGNQGPVDRATANLLTASVERQVEALKRWGIAMLLVDITANGGGSNWLEPVARMLTDVRLQAPRVGFIRHPHYERIFQDRIRELEGAHHDAPAHLRPLIERGLQTYRTAISEAARACDRMGLWEGRSVACSGISTEPPIYATGLLPYAAPGSLPMRPWNTALFYPSRYVYREGVYPGPLVVLVDAGTASAAEYFAAMLRDNQAALLVGVPTAGAGCGYVNGGVPATLARSGGRVTMPDCVRLRADGSNEVAGLTPDVMVPWRANDNAYQRARRVVDLLPQVLERASSTLQRSRAK